MKMGVLHTFIPRVLRGQTAIVIPESEGDTFHSDPPVASADIVFDSGKSVIRLVDLIVERAHAARVSDIHLDPRSDGLHVLLRIDGVLQDSQILPMALHAEIISRIKILSGMRTDEHSGAQDGRFRVQMAAGASIDIRVSIVPTYYGENAVLRLLSDSAETFSLASLGFTVRNRDTIARALARPHGMILATGPTGSGKTTTMYTLVKMLAEPGISVVTLEDPIEYSIDGVSQIQINPRTGLTFGNGLRSILRQDPNVIMVGEIRDEETAGLAINTALTGHRLLSTVHTNDAPTTITRLLDMGVEPYLVASTVSLAIGQRLVRRICESCKIVHQLDDAEIMSLSKLVPTEFLHAMPTFFRGNGCTACNGSGFLGRAGIHEVMEISADLRAAIVAKKPSSEVRNVAVSEGMIPIMIDGLRKAARGITTITEVLKSRYE
jgi:type II secretory ATPase GspE/PulE/Tfp pilus assembly ATPase PilB-like protein